MQRLNEESLAEGVQQLCAREPALARIVDRLGPPPLWGREPGFSTLVHIILEQQVSLASARAAHDRLLAASGTLTPERFLQFDDAQLKAIGFSRQKTGYARGVARAILEGRLELAALEEAEDEAVVERLTGIKGIGPWTAHIYLLMALGRPDAWPAGDRALALAVQRALGLPACPGPEDLAGLGAAWQPLRAVAARIFWNDYLNPIR